MARSGTFQALRRRGAMFCAVLAYALLLNALLAAAFNVQAIAAALDPLAVAATCDSSSSGTRDNPIRHNSQHQPDCTLCSPACPMGGMVQGLGSAVAVVATPPASFGLKVSAQQDSSIHARSVYVSDTSAQAPPAIG